MVIKHPNAPHEQHAQYAQYGGRSIRMHPEDAPGEDVSALVLPRRRPVPRLAQSAHTPSRPSGERPLAPAHRAAQPVLDELDNDALYDERARSSSRRYVPIAQVAHEGETRVRVQHHSAPVKRRASQDFLFQAPAHHAPERGAGTMHHARRLPWAFPRRLHWFFYAGSVAACFLAGCLIWTPVTSWWSTQQNDAQYGRPRTYQTDAVVGHLDSPTSPSHFLAENLDRHVVVIEFEGGDPRKAISYVGPTLMGAGQDLAPVMLSFQDVNHDGKPDMLLHIEGSTMVFVNTGKTFRPATPTDHLTL